MKQGEAVFLTTSPDMRGNVSLVEKDHFWVTWHSFVDDRPEALKLKVMNGFKRTRVRYRNYEARIVGFGVPEGDLCIVRDTTMNSSTTWCTTSRA